MLDEGFGEERVGEGERREEVVSSLEELSSVVLDRGEQVLQEEGMSGAKSARGGAASVRLKGSLHKDRQRVVIMSSTGQTHLLTARVPPATPRAPSKPP